MTFACPNQVVSKNLKSQDRRMQFDIEGVIQGVGFRPYVSRLALSLGLNGWVANSANGVSIDIEGETNALDKFKQLLTKQIPPLARIDHIQQQELTPNGYRSFNIKESNTDTVQTALILPDVATCQDCIDEILDKNNRRYTYSFTNCTNCGPRFSILGSLPFDRPNTMMKDFRMCNQCQFEYESADNRRYHAQANACQDCGPQLSFWDQAGQTLAKQHHALLVAADALREGKIVALKGIGGFQLLVDARHNEAILKLRQRKARPDKPFALMFPSEADVELYCEISELEHGLLNSHAAPIVLLKRHSHKNNTQSLAEAIAPNIPYYGVMLPYSPLHHLLMHELGFPVIATSGNLSGDPIVIDEHDALIRLNKIADCYLIHDRPIVTPLDDSVVQVVAGRSMIMRRARGLAPFSLPVSFSGQTILALGGHLKSTVTMMMKSRIIMSPHIGNLDNVHSRQQYHATIEHLKNLHNSKPSIVACDQHPGYYSSQYANSNEFKIIPVQHHVAHIVACMAENNINEPVLGVAWDGAGYGEQDTIWGSEFFIIDGLTVTRVASLRSFTLPGGDKAIEEPRRAAMGLLYELFGSDAFTDETLKPLNTFSINDRNLLQRMLERNINSPMTSSMGRLFDAVASLTGLMQTTSFEGQAAMALEYSIDKEISDRSYAFMLNQDNQSNLIIIDWQPMILALVKDIKAGATISNIAVTFHNTLIKIILSVAQRIGKTNIVLSGGCFQNRYLTEGAIQKLNNTNFQPRWHQHLPPNDGGLAFGQAVWASKQIEAGVI